MTVRAFADTNIAVYAESDDGEKSKRARTIIEAAPVVSAQIINETVAVLIGKHRFSLADAYEVGAGLMDLCEIVPVSAETIREASRLAIRYQLSHWDALVVAAALMAGCETLYTEDLQHGQIFDGRLTVVNPFL